MIPLFLKHKLLDSVCEILKVKNDRELAKRLAVGPPVISKVRNRRSGVSDALIVSIHEETGISICDLRQLAVESDPAGIGKVVTQVRPYNKTE